MRRGLQQRALNFGLVHMGREDRDDGASDLILDREDVFQLSVVALGPAVRAGGGIDELRRDADTVAGATDAAFEDVANAELAADLSDVRRFAFVLESLSCGR